MSRECIRADFANRPFHLNGVVAAKNSEPHRLPFDRASFVACNKATRNSAMGVVQGTLVRSTAPADNAVTVSVLARMTVAVSFIKISTVTISKLTCYITKFGLCAKLLCMSIMSFIG